MLELSSAQRPLSRSCAGDREERLTWWPLSSFITKQCRSAATPGDTDPAEVTGFCQNLLPRSSQLENTLHCDRKTTTTCRLENFQQNIFSMIYLHPCPVASLSDFLIWGDFENLSDPGRIQWSRVAKSPTRHADFGFIELWERESFHFPMISTSTSTGPNYSNPDLTLIKSLYHERYFIPALKLRIIISRFSELVLV